MQGVTINSNANNETVPGYQNPLLIRPDRPLPASVAIIGAGTIGPDLAYYLKSAIPGLELVLIDIAQGALDRATQRIEGYVDKGLKRGKLTAQQAAGVRENIYTSLDYSAMANFFLMRRRPPRILNSNETYSVRWNR